MLLIHIILLATVQGVTEFLPVSSSAHLLILHKFLDNGNSFTFDIALHAGSLVAVILYFFHDFKKLCIGGLHICINKKTQASNLTKNIIAASIPIVIIGLLLSLLGEIKILRNIYVISLSLGIFGFILYLADKKSTGSKTIDQLSFKNALFIGIWQTCSIIPGASRSGTTITALRMININKHDAVKFSMLLSIIANSGAIVLSMIHMYTHRDYSYTNLDMLIGASIAFLVGYATIRVLINIVNVFSFKLFAIYRIILSIILIVYIAITYMS